MDDLAALPPTFRAPELPRPPVPPEHVALDTRGPDPLECGFLLAGGVLAPLPARVRLPHEDEPVE